LDNIIDIFKPLLPAIEAELKKQVARLDEPSTHPFYEMLTYHMGWTDEGAGSKAIGKRIRPLLVLFTTIACEYKWLHALPAAAAVELIHNFSLVHDDIQDRSEKRRGRPSVWSKWGVPLAINVGDGLFVLSDLAVMDLTQHFPSDVVLKTAGILHGACLNLTCGQFLDMSYEDREDITVDDYWPMVGNKTASLLSACTHIGALLGGVTDEKQEAYSRFGYHLGLAFQIQDDILGIWGDETKTGKSTASDLVEAKMSLPVLFGLGIKNQFSKRWKQGAIAPDEANKVAAMLAEVGAYEYTQNVARQETHKALECLKQAEPQGEAGQVLFGLADQLLNREQ
jgi:geranylgeranyl diphosphate synthase type I